MSWSVSAAGTRAEIAAELDRYGAQLTGQSKIEFDGAVPHLKALVEQNFHKDGDPKLQLSAYGSGWAATSAEGTEQVSRDCGVTLKRL